MTEARILLLEDDDTMREVLTSILTAEGYEVLGADRGERALELALQEPFDLLIFDIRMEGLDGLETLALMHQRGQDFPSLAITGFAGDDAPIRALRLGVGEYLRKPFQTAQLLEAVTRLLARHQRQQAEGRRLASLQETVRWAVGPTPAGQLAAALGTELGLPLPGCIELEVAATLHDRLADGPLAAWATPEPLEGRILAIATAAARLPEDGLPRGEQLRRQGSFDPLLLESLDRLGGPRTGRSLLGLVQVLLMRGEREGARQALRTVLMGEPSGPLGVDAWLSLLELTEDADELEHLLPEALEWARRVGPLSLARTSYRGGLQLLRLRRPSALLAQAHAQLQALELRAEAAVCQILTEGARDDLLTFLLQAENEAELAGAVDVLAPLLSGPWQARLATRFPRSFRQSGPGLLRLRSFGLFSVDWGGTLLEEEAWRGPTVRYLLAYLAAQSRPVHEDQLCAAFWPEGPETSRKRLSNTLSSLRRTFREVHAGSDFNPIVRQRELYQLNPGVEVWHDLTELERAFQAGQWRKVSQLYTAPYLEGCYLEWALLTRERVERQVVHALEQLAGLELETRPEQALEDAQRLLTLDAFHLPGNLLVMKAWVRGGRPELAVRHFQKLEGQLRRELGVEPPLELVEAFHRARLAVP